MYFFFYEDTSLKLFKKGKYRNFSLNVANSYFFYTWPLHNIIQYAFDYAIKEYSSLYSFGKCLTTNEA